MAMGRRRCLRCRCGTTRPACGLGGPGGGLDIRRSRSQRTARQSRPVRVGSRDDADAGRRGLRSGGAFGRRACAGRRRRGYVLRVLRGCSRLSGRGRAQSASPPDSPSARRGRGPVPGLRARSQSDSLLWASHWPWPDLRRKPWAVRSHSGSAVRYALAGRSLRWKPLGRTGPQVGRRAVLPRPGPHPWPQADRARRPWVRRRRRPPGRDGPAAGRRRLARRRLAILVGVRPFAQPGMLRHAGRWDHLQRGDRLPGLPIEQPRAADGPLRVALAPPLSVAALASLLVVVFAGAGLWRRRQRDQRW